MSTGQQMVSLHNHPLKAIVFIFVWIRGQAPNLVPKHIGGFFFPVIRTELESQMETQTPHPCLYIHCPSHLCGHRRSRLSLAGTYNRHPRQQVKGRVWGQVTHSLWLWNVALSLDWLLPWVERWKASLLSSERAWIRTLYHFRLSDA